MFPVPLNSWKITSSMREPVSTSAVARIVRLPEPSQLRAAPKNWRGNCSARLSTPPDIVRPPGPISRFDARPSRVSESSRITTWRPGLDQPLGALDREPRQPDVRVGARVGGGGEHLGRHHAPEVRDLFRPLVDEQQDQVHLGVALDDRLAEVLEQRRLARLRRRDDQPALALAHRGDDVDHTQADLGALAREVERLARVDRDEVLEMRQRAILRGLHSASLRDFYENAASVATIARQAVYLRSVAQVRCPVQRRTGPRRLRAAADSSVRPA